MPRTSLPENEVAELKEHFELFDLHSEGELLGSGMGANYKS